MSLSARGFDRGTPDSSEPDDGFAYRYTLVGMMKVDGTAFWYSEDSSSSKSSWPWNPRNGP